MIYEQLLIIVFSINLPQGSLNLTQFRIRHRDVEEETAGLGKNLKNLRGEIVELWGRMVHLEGECCKGCGTPSPDGTSHERL